MNREQSFTLWRRRAFLLGGGAAALAACAGARDGAVDGAPRRARSLSDELADLERRSGGRLGAYVLDTASGEGQGYREGERFGMCSTFKLSLAALVLREADQGRLALDDKLPFRRADLLEHSPSTEPHADEGGMTVAALAEAAQLTSDNTAANLLLARVGGPAAVTAFWRELGDEGSRLDRVEPELNLVPPGELRDTVVPAGIARAVARFTIGDVLAPASRARLLGWMERTETGKRRIRAALPEGWRAGDKTGTLAAAPVANKTNDLAVLMPPNGRAPIVVVGFYESDASYEEVRPRDEAVLAELGRIAFARLGA